MAMDKIKPTGKKKRIHVSLIVIRISKDSLVDSYKLCNSKPCISCIYKINNFSNAGYKITKIYFSNNIGHLVCLKTTNLVKQPKLHVTKYYRNHKLPKKILSYT